MRRGFSLAELVMVLAVIGAMLGIAAPRLWGWRDAWAVERATREVMQFYDAARFRAIARSQRVRCAFATDSLRAVAEGVVDTAAFTRPGPARYGVTLVASRAVLRIGPTGLGWGAANTKLVLRRGVAAESLTTSRLGRLKRWN